MALEEYITVQRIASSIILNSKSYDSFMVVEGTTDYDVFKKFIKNAYSGLYPFSDFGHIRSLWINDF